MKSYLFDVTVLATIRVEATNKEEAEKQIMDCLSGATANFGSWPDGTPILSTIDIEGQIDLMDVDD
jgi:hypothetical protein